MFPKFAQRFLGPVNRLGNAVYCRSQWNRPLQTQVSESCERGSGSKSFIQFRARRLAGIWSIVLRALKVSFIFVYFRLSF